MSFFQFLIPTVSELLFVFTLLVLFFCGYWYLSVPRGLPPGPLGVPVLGYLPFIRKHCHVQFCEIAQKYGNIFSLYLGNQLTVVLNDFDSINEAFIREGEVFSGRPKLPGADLNPDKFQNLASSDGNHWKEQRHFAMSSLKDLGLGKTSIEPKISDEVHHFCDELRKLEGVATDFTQLLGLSVANNMCIMIFGKRFEYDDEFLIALKRDSDEVTANTNHVGISNFFPWILEVPVVSRLFDNRRQLKVVVNRNVQKVAAIVKEYEESHAHGVRDNYINACLNEAAHRKEKRITDLVFNDSALGQNIRVLIGAGSETTTNALTWGIVYMLNYPKVQLRVQKEIDAQIGCERSPSWSDRVRTPYTEATILEILRMASFVPLSLVHRTTKDVRVKGYFIPKDSYILPNLWNVHHDAKLWKDPEEFRPERFLSETGEVVKPDYFIPFSIGKRRCLGESLANVELYLYFATLMQQFDLKAPNDSAPSMDAKRDLEFILQPKQFKVSFLPRYKN